MFDAFLVVGGESTGTRLVTEVLIALGCHGDSGHKQRLDTDIDKGEDIPMPFVWRRSMPHQKKFVSIQHELIEPVFDLGLDGPDICILVTTRNWLCAASSAVRAGHAHNVGHALANLEQAYVEIFETLSDFHKIKYHLISFDFLVQRPTVYLPYIAKQLGFDNYSDTVAHDIYDANEPYVWETIIGKRQETDSTKK